MLKLSIDLALWCLAVPLAFLLRLETKWLAYADGMAFFLLVSIPFFACLLALGRLYQRSWHKPGLRDLMALGLTILGTTAALETLALLGMVPVPRSIPLLVGLIALLLMCGVRLATRSFVEESIRLSATKSGKGRRVLIAGAGEAGTMIAREMLRNPHSMLIPVGFLDDAPFKKNLRYVGLRVHGTLSDLPAVVKEQRVNEVLIAMPSQGGDVVRRVVQLAREAGVKHRTIPGMMELLSGKLSISHIREVAYEDLLRRPPVRLEMDRIAAYIKDRVVMVTGAGGSIGSEIVRQVARFDPTMVVLYERSEANLYDIDMEMRERLPHLAIVPVAGDVGDPDMLEHVFTKYDPEVVFHAAAYKHVPLMESNPWQAILNNVAGTQTLVSAALACGVKRFVNISTDKAVNPTSVMGASKRLAEMVVSAAGEHAGKQQAFTSVRFGNVLGSNGSVVPRFKKQIERGGPVTVTHPEMTRYFMTIPEASQLVLQAASLAENDRLYVLDMGKPVKIMDLARDLIMLSGLEPGEDIEIEITGMRPGEKLYEEILTTAEGMSSSTHEKIFVARKKCVPEDALNHGLQRLFRAARDRDEAALRRLLDELVPENHFVHSGDGSLAGGDGSTQPAEIRVQVN